MAYNRRNYLTKVIEIQNIVLELKGRDGDMRLKNIYWSIFFLNISLVTGLLAII